jgi:hypothetical protein
MHGNFGADTSRCIVDVLALPLLWACHEPSLALMIHPQILSRVQQGCNSINGQHGITYNPVYKFPLHISRVENLVFIQDAVIMGEGEDEATGGSQAAKAATQSNQSNQIQALLLPINLMVKGQAENQKQLQQHMSELYSYTATQFKQVHTNMNRFASSPER